MLDDLGWDTKNPARGGDVYEQGEFRHHDSLLTKALGCKTPENIVRIPWDGGFRYWIVEAKKDHKDLSKAVLEAQEYCNESNRLGGQGGDMPYFLRA